MKIKRTPHNQIKVTYSDNSFIESGSVESNLLFAILEKLEEIRCGLIDVEDSIGKPAITSNDIKL